jgi:hypothetical protein
MRRTIRLLVGLPARYHFWGSLAIVVGVGLAISSQMSDRRNFADSELHRDVMERWGAPIVQPSPSVRFVPSCSVFNALQPLPLARQEVAVDTRMNYRRRGLVFFSGFDFALRGDYTIRNDQGRDVDVVFVFPISVEKNRVLLSDLAFTVDGAPAKAELGEGADKLVWTGRLPAGGQVAVHVAFRGRGLDSFTYALDPSQPVKQFHLALTIAGGDHFDYADGVVPAAESRVEGGAVRLDWRYGSLESGIPAGVILPSEKAYDALVATMVRRAWAPFLLFFAGVVALCVLERRQLRFYESYLVAAAYALFFVLLPYLAAFVNFYLAWAASLAIVGVLLWSYVRLALSPLAARYLLPLLGSTLVVPNVAVALQGYTGLVYTLETTALLAVAMYVTSRGAARARIEQFVSNASSDAAVAEGGTHA